MIERANGVTSAPKRTVADLVGEAKGLLEKEVRDLKRIPADKSLPAEELAKMDALARMIAKTVLQDMNIA